MIEVPISIGELVDKITILEIKSFKITNSKQLAFITKEYEALLDKMHNLGLEQSAKLYHDLSEVNRSLWDIEDSIRIKEGKGEFDDEFIRLARSVYFQNDKRATIKRVINETTNSELVEVKQYSKY